MSRATDLPDYERPPIDEVAIGYLFPPVLNYSDSLVGAFWQSVRGDYPRMEPQPRVEAPLETLDSGPLPMQQAFMPIFGPDQGRTWFISGDDQFVLQLQNTRFFLNWRKRHNDYPHFDDIKQRFLSMFELYRSFLNEHRAGPPAIQQLEVSYINWIRDTDISQFFRPASSAVIDVDHVGGEPTSVAWAFRYLVNGRDERPIAGLHVQCVPSLRVEPPERGSQLQLTFRAPMTAEPNEKLLDELSEAARDAIVRTFTALTTDKAHTAWGRSK